MFWLRRSMVGKKAPDVSGEAWFNVTSLPAAARQKVKESEAVELRTDLSGYVTLIEIWGYSCKSCIDSLPDMRKLWKKYRDQNFLLIGVHTPEFDYERDPDKVEDAIIRFNLSYPVVSDPEYDTWDRYHNKAWPRILVVNKKGRIVYDQEGEGNYDKIEMAIKRALK